MTQVCAGGRSLASMSAAASSASSRAAPGTPASGARRRRRAELFDDLARVLENDARAPARGAFAPVGFGQARAGTMTSSESGGDAVRPT